jgi:molecular chaperone GrpE
VVIGDQSNRSGSIRVPVRETGAAGADNLVDMPLADTEATDQTSGSLEARLMKAQGQAEEYLDQWRRSAAQFANYKKRIEKEQTEFSKLANANLITKLLPVIDDFQRAMETMDDSIRRHPWTSGLDLIQRKLQQVLMLEGVEEIPTEGERFDPGVHQAVTYEEADGHEEGEIIAEVQKGYRLGDRVLRASMVRVAR